MLLIKDAYVHPMTDRPVFTGDILIGDNGKIVDLGPEIEAPEAEVLDAAGLHALPGLVDAHTHLGGMDFSQLESSSDLNEMTRSIYPEVRAIYGTDIREQSFQGAWQAGVTTVCVTPGSGNLVNGLAYATKTYGSNIFEMCIKDPVALKIALGGNPKGVYGERNQAPASRMSMPAMLRDLFDRARQYGDNKESGKEPVYSAELDAVLMALNGQIPLKMHCTQFDMLTCIEIAREYGVAFSLEHAWGARDYMEELVASGASICFGPIGTLTRPGECALVDIESVVELDRRGVLTALVTDAPLLSIDSLVPHAGEAVRNGLEVERALRMITCNAARIMGIDQQVGSLAPGMDGDVAIFAGLPAWDISAKIRHTVFEGKVIYTGSV